MVFYLAVSNRIPQGSRLRRQRWRIRGICNPTTGVAKERQRIAVHFVEIDAVQYPIRCISVGASRGIDDAAVYDGSTAPKTKRRR